jgi:hypothetical protein
MRLEIVERIRTTRLTTLSGSPHSQAHHNERILKLDDPKFPNTTVSQSSSSISSSQSHKSSSSHRTRSCSNPAEGWHIL